MDNNSKILIVDDEKGLRVGTKRLLEKEGYLVDTAENGSDGVKLGTSTDYDIAIIDLKMPDLDGISVLKEIRKSFPNTICFIATAYASYETAIESTKVGAFSYIPKPFTPEELLQKVKAGLERRMILCEAEKWKKEREERLLEVAFEKTRLNTIINSINDGVLVVNIEGAAVLFNPAVLRLLQLETITLEEEIISKLHPEIAEIINKILNLKVYEKKSYSIQFEPAPQGGLFVEVTASPVPHPDGSLAGVAVVLKDISELKKIENLKSQFVSMVSHELKAPIAAVHGFLKLILDKSIPLTRDQEIDFLDRSQKRLDSLLRMVNDLLDISRIETKTIHREIKELDLKEIISSILEIFHFEIEKKQLTISRNFAEDLPKLKADNEEILRLYTNLLSNSIKYNINGGTINIKCYGHNNHLVTEIIDNGIGMKPEEKTRLFKDFFRAKNEFTKNINGTGLGLSIVKRIVETYSGKIEVESEYKKGTTFKITFPL